MRAVIDGPIGDQLLKEIKESYADHPESRRRFIVEAEITGCLLIIAGIVVLLY